MSGPGDEVNANKKTGREPMAHRNTNVDVIQDIEDEQVRKVSDWNNKNYPKVSNVQLRNCYHENIDLFHFYLSL